MPPLDQAAADLGAHRQRQQLRSPMEHQHEAEEFLRAAGQALQEGEPALAETYARVAQVHATLATIR